MPMKIIRRPQRAVQRGLTLLGLLFWAIVIVVVATTGIKVAPSVSEYMACVKGIKQASFESTPDDARNAFDRYASVGYITAIAGKDLDITPGPNGGLTVSFAYDKEIRLMGPVYLLIKYHRSTSHKGVS